MAIYNAAWAIPLLPLLGALLSFGVETQRRAAQLCVVLSGLSFVVAAILLGVRVTHSSAGPFVSLLTFFSMLPPEGTIFATQFQAQVGVQVDALSASFAAAIAFATVLIQAYALTAMRGDAGFRRFFWASSLLGFSTTGFVLSPNLFDSLIMWVAASASLYLLVSLAWQRTDVAVHALRAMAVLTAGDIALTLGVVYTWIKFGIFSSLLAAPPGQTIADPFSFNVLSQGVLATVHMQVAGAGPRAIAVMGIVFVVAAAVRTAQFPFHVWLRDAAASAVPVLALAAATVAPLGLFLLARVYPVLAHSPRVLAAAGLVGGVSAVLTAAIGVTQRNVRHIAVCAVVVGARPGPGGAGHGRIQSRSLHRVHLGVHIHAAPARRGQSHPGVSDRRHHRDGRGLDEAACHHHRAGSMGVARRWARAQLLLRALGGLQRRRPRGRRLQHPRAERRDDRRRDRGGARSAPRRSRARHRRRRGCCPAPRFPARPAGRRRARAAPAVVARALSRRSWRCWLESRVSASCSTATMRRRSASAPSPRSSRC